MGKIKSSEKGRMWGKDKKKKVNKKSSIAFDIFTLIRIKQAKNTSN